MRSEASVTVIIPALNEETSLPGVLARIPAWVDRIIVVDNGSTDSTAGVARQAGATVVGEPRRGYGRACLAGIAAASDTEVLVFVDADGSDFPEHMDRLVDPIVAGKADLVVGSRVRGRLEPGAMTAAQRFGNALAPALIRWLWGERFTDLGPFRTIRSAALHQLGMDDQTFGWTVQMQVRAARFGLRCAEVPVNYARRTGGRSKISGTIRGTCKAGAKILACVAREYLWPQRKHPHTAESLAVFAKFPAPGHAKTRLIPALGAQGAADLHERMVRLTLARVDELRRARGVGAEVWHTGNDAADFAGLFGGTFLYRQQAGADLGARMLHAFRVMLRDASAAVIIGTDCPELSAAVLRSAFDELQRHDLVLGPATDGGYYLIGLRRPVPGLFDGMTWSTDGVLAETLGRARALGLSVHLLPTLDDVDDPGDLPVWEQAGVVHEADDRESPILSVIIPTLNEAHGIARIIDSVRRPGVEVIVADGGSTDGTRRIAAEHGARVALTPAGRGPQLNAGAALARADRLLFLHADTVLPFGYVDAVLRVLADQRVAIGAFRFKVDRPGWLLRAVEVAVRLRCALFRTPYGDQALFTRTGTFRMLGGYAGIPLMEDLDLVRRARVLGDICVVAEPATISSRRWVAAGVIRTTAINQLCVLGFALGVAPQRLAAWRNRLASDGRLKGPAAHSEPEGSLAPKAMRALSIAGPEVDARK